MRGWSGHSELFVLPLQMLSLGRLGLPRVSGSGVLPLPSFQVSNQHEWCVFQPSCRPTEGCNSSTLKPVLPYDGVSHRGNGPFETPHKGNYLLSVPSRNRDSRHGLPCSLPLVKAPKTQSSQLQQDTSMYCLEPSPHKDWPNLTPISLSYLVSHVNMKGI